MMTAIVVLIVSGALIIGALWGLYGKLSKRLEGFLVALAGGALLVSALLEFNDSNNCFTIADRKKTNANNAKT